MGKKKIHHITEDSVYKKVFSYIFVIKHFLDNYLADTLSTSEISQIKNISNEFVSSLIQLRKADLVFENLSLLVKQNY